MRPVSQEYKDAFLADTPDVKREVSYKRRYWNAAAQDYAWESSWTVLSEDMVAAVSPITEQLDTERLNEFKVSNITLTLKNDDNRWRSDNPSGIFGPDSASPLYPYSDHWTKFRVRIGVRLQDGSYEYTARFVGLAVEYTHSSQDEVQVNVQGLESLLQNANAENVSTRVVEENVGSGNGVLVDFDTANPGVGIVEEVSVAGIAQVPGTDYSVTDLNDPTVGATITFTAAPASGTIRVTYRYWQQSQTVEDLVEDLLTEAGIAGADQIVDPVLFPGGVIQAISKTSQADWTASTLTGLEATSTPGDVIIDYPSDSGVLFDAFTDNDYTSNPVWTKFDGGDPGTVSAATGKVVVSRPVSSGNISSGLFSASDRAAGKWKFTVRRDGAVSSMAFYFMKQTSSLATIDGYQLFWTQATGVLSLFKDGGSAISSIIHTWSDATDYAFVITRDRSGNIKVYIGGTLKISVTDTTHTTSNYISMRGGIGFADTGTVSFDDIYLPTTTQTGTLVSATVDTGSTPSAWGRLTANQTLNGDGVGAFYTRVSSDNVSWDADVAVAGNGQIMSALKRYIKVVWVPAASSAGGNDSILHDFTFQYTTSSTTIALANFTGKTVYQQIQELGAFANYEWGFTPDEDFFFRAKEVAQTADVEIDEGTHISEINGLVTGQDRVYSEVRATYGEFTASVRVAGDTEGDARAKYGSRILEVSGGDVLVADDANIAAGVAAGLAVEVSRPRRRMKAACKLLPYVDLSDVVLISFNQNQPLPSWHHGDTTAELGDQDLHHYGPRQQLVSEMYAKVVGARHDPDNFKTELDLQEVL